MSQYRETVVAWALACLRGKERPPAKTARRGRSSALPIDVVVERFALDAGERRVIELAYAVERSLEVAREARAASGARGLTVELVRDALACDASPAPGGRLRRHGLIVVDDGFLGAASAELRLAPGLAARLDGETVGADLLGPATRRIPSPPEGWSERFPPTERLIDLVRDQLGGGARLLTVEGCGRREAIALGVLAARALGRGVLLLDGEALAPLAGAWALVAAARREADLDGEMLLVTQSAALGEAWRAAAVGEPAQPLVPSLVVLADGARPREVALDEGLPHQSVLLVPITAVAGTPSPAASKPKEDDGFDHIRQLAVRDAERALGIARREDPKPAARPPTPPPTTANQTANANANANPAIANANATPANATPPNAGANPAATDGAPKVKKRSKKGMQYFGDPDAAPEPAPRPTPPPVAAAPPPLPLPSAPPVIDPASALPAAAYVDVPADAPPDALARIASTCPNPNQRIDLLNQLRGYKTAPVVAAIRLNARSEHAGVRAAAETLMAMLFGAEWNRTRAVPKPVQRPTDDKESRSAGQLVRRA